MLTINANTKIAKILKENPDALEAIVSISPKFTKLRNPLLRKLMASRTSLTMASKIGGCTVNDFFDKLRPLGFEIDESVSESEENKAPVPQFITDLRKEDIVELDVRPVLDAGQDPLKLIMEYVNKLKPNESLKLINNFEPTPLIILLEKQGFVSYMEIINEDLINTYFYKPSGVDAIKAEIKNDPDSWENMVQKYDGRLTTVKVDKLEPPLPMLTILDELDKLPEDKALYVYHKRIPVFLLPELKDRDFDYRIKEVGIGNVHLLIFKPE